MISPEYYPWLWIVAGILLMISEFVVPGMFVIFIGFGSLVTGFISLFIPLTTWEQLLIMALLSIVSILFGSAFIKRIFPSEVTQDPIIKDEYRNEIVNVVSDILVNQKGGRIRYKGTEWDAISESARIPKGRRVRIISRDNLTFLVEPLE